MVPAHIQLVRLVIRKMRKRLRHPREIMLMCVRWYATCLSSLRNLDGGSPTTTCAWFELGRDHLPSALFVNS